MYGMHTDPKQNLPFKKIQALENPWPEQNQSVKYDFP